MNAPYKLVLVGLLFGLGIGGMLGTSITLHFTTKQVDDQTVMIAASQANATAKWEQTLGMAQKVIDTWRNRAESCEANFASYTVVYERQDIASIPVLNGALSIALRPTGQGAIKPALYVPAKVDVYTTRPDVAYQWVNAKTGESSAIQLPHAQQ